MATPQFKKNSNGEVLKQLKTASMRDGKKPFKSTTTNKTKSSSGEVGTASASTPESEDDEADSSAIDEPTNSDEDADVFALPKRHQQTAGAAVCHSAGPQSTNEDMMMIDDAQAVAGAADVTDDEDDEHYADVEDASDSEISDGDINERDVRRTIEDDLIGEFERVEQRREANGMSDGIGNMILDDNETGDIELAQQLSLQEAEDTIDLDFDFEVNMDEDPFVGLSGDHSTYKDMLGEAEDEIALWRTAGPASAWEKRNANSGTQKRVRFEEGDDTASRASSPSSSEDANDAFPDLFAAQDDPAIQRLGLELDDDNGLLPYNSGGDLESCYDFDGDEEGIPLNVGGDDDTDESEDDSDISDTDSEGDTTDEDSPEERLALLKERRAAAARENGVPATPASKRPVSRTSSTPTTPRPVTPRSGKGPQMGTFARDPTRALITNNPLTKGTNVQPPTEIPEKDRAFWEQFELQKLRAARRGRGLHMPAPSPSSESMPDRPFTAKSTLGTMFNGNLDLLRNNDPTADKRRMPPPTLGKSASFSATTTTEDSEDDFPDVNMEDFIDMSDSESDDDRPSSSYLESPSGSEVFGSSQTAGMPPSTPGLLNHFELNRGLVGSFRRNQQHTKHFSSLPSHPATRASAHEYNALQKGRRGAANMPMTPARKKRASQDLTQSTGGVRKGVSSPLASRRPRSRGNSINTKNAAGLYNTLAGSPF